MLDLACSLNSLLITIEFRGIIKIGYAFPSAIFIAAFIAVKLSKRYIPHFGSDLRLSIKAELSSALMQTLIECFYTRKVKQFMLFFTLLKITSNYLIFGS